MFAPTSSVTAKALLKCESPTLAGLRTLAMQTAMTNLPPEQDVPRLGETEEFLVQLRALALTAPEPWRSRILNLFDEATEDDGD
jgi:hypothetical protein